MCCLWFFFHLLAVVFALCATGVGEHDRSGYFVDFTDSETEKKRKKERPDMHQDGRNLSNLVSMVTKVTQTWDDNNEPASTPASTPASQLRHPAVLL